MNERNKGNANGTPHMNDRVWKNAKLNKIKTFSNHMKYENNRNVEDKKNRLFQTSHFSLALDKI